MLRYFCTHTDLRFLGKVKLMKLFYFADFMHIKKYGVPITYDVYYKLEHGPIPTVIKNLVDFTADDPETAVLSDAISVERVKGTNMQRVSAIKNFKESDKNYFSDQELEILHKVCSRFGNKNTLFVEEASHRESAWSNSKMNHPIPYKLAALDNDCLLDAEEIELLTSL